MFKNHLRVALRSLIKNKGYTFISLLGLSVAICCCILISLFVRSEFSYDTSYAKADRLYRAWMYKREEGRDGVTSTITSIPMGPALQAKVAGVESACRICKFNTLIKFEGNRFNESVHMVDTTLFHLFDFKLAEGNSHCPWPNGNSLVITETIAKKYFGNKEALGRNMELQLADEKVMFQVSAVVKDIRESSIKMDFLIPFSNDHFLFNARMRSAWINMASTETYVLLNNASSAHDVEKRIPLMLQQVLGTPYSPGSFNIYLQPVKDIHLNTTLPPGLEPVGNPWYVYLLSVIAFLILFNACVNFITLSIGRSTTRRLEVGVRKVLGAGRHQIIRQFFAETFIITLASAVTGWVLSLILFNPFNQLTGMGMDYRIDPSFLLFGLLLIVSVSLITGVYPAILVSRFNPSETLKGKISFGQSAGVFRKTLITAQFTVSILMLICSWIIVRQLNYMKNKNLGYQGGHVVVISTDRNSNEGLQLGKRYQNILLRLPEVKSASLCMYSLNETPWPTMGYTDNKGIYRSFDFNSVDVQFLKTMGIPLASGDNFFGNDDSAVLVNESFVKEYGWKNPIGQKLPGPFNQKIRGVMKDFNVESLHTRIKPLILSTRFESISVKAETMLIHHAMQPEISVRLASGNLNQQLEALKRHWQTVAPNQEFNYHFLDETLARQYKKEERTASITELASTLSIFISCLGLLGLVTLVITRRTREIAIRKVLGSSVSGIVSLISKDFLKLIALAACISFPLASLALNHWLNHFAYRISLSWWVFGAAAVLVLFISLMTISVQAYSAALKNPAKNMRSE